MICACVLSILEVNLWSSSWSTFIFAPWLILMSWRPYWYLHYASFLQDIITNISIQHDHIKFLLEYHIGHHLLILMLQHSILRAQWILHLNYLLQDILIHDSTYELIMILSSSICRILLFNHSLKILIHHGSIHKPWCMHINMYMAFISNPFYLLLASPWNKHPSVHPIFFMH